MIFHDLSAFSQHFPAVFRGSPAPSLFSKLRRRDDERHNVGRGKGLGKDAGAAQAGEVRRLIRLAQVGAPGDGFVGGGFSSNFICFFFKGILEFRGWTVLNQVFWGMILGENGDIWIGFMRFWSLVFAFWAVLIRGQTLKYIWLFRKMAIWGWVKLLWWMERDVYYFDVNSWVFGFWTRSYLLVFLVFHI